MGKDAQEFVPWLAIGLTIWQLIMAVVVEGATTFTTAAGIIHNIPMPLTVHVYRMVMRHILNYFHNFLIVIVVLILFPSPLSPIFLLFVPGFLIIMVTATACSVVLGIFGARYRDFSYTIRMLMGPMFFLTPVIWSPDGLTGGRAQFANMNPFAHFLAIIREPLLGRVPTTLSYVVALGFMIFLALMALHMLGKHRQRIPYWIG